MILPGSYLEYIQDKKLLSAICLRQDKPGRVFVRNARGKEEKLADSKAMFVTASCVDPNASYDVLEEAMAKIAARRESLAASVSTAELWELMGDEDSDKVWTLNELSDLALSDSNNDCLSALYRVLENDSVYFIRKGSGYVLRSKEQVEEIFVRQRTEAANKLEHECLSKWLLELWSRPAETSAPLEYPAEYESAARRALANFADVAVNGQESYRLKDVSNLLKSINITRKDAPFQFMLKAGLWTKDENLALYKYNIQLEFSAEQLQEAEETAALLDAEGNIIISDDELASRADLTDLECFTIDDATTTDIDDALSFEENSDGTFRIGIHIADASYYVTPESLIDGEARVRGTAVYLPDLKIPMCPAALSESVCSLVADKRRLAFSFLVNFDSDFNLTDFRMVSSVIKVKERHTYQTANEALAEGRWQKFLAIARKLVEKRQENGSISIPFPRVNVKVCNGEILIERDNPNSPSQILVSEMMILANSIAGRYLADREAPGIFRSQEAPEQPLGDLEDGDPVKLYNIRRFIRKGTMGLEPARHNGLGLDSYVQVTSPIRRYNDLLMQRQLKTLLSSGEPLYSTEDLGRALAYTKQSTSLASSLEQERKNYWLLRYLEEHAWEDMEAVVLANHPDRHIVQLCNCLLESDCPQVPGHPLPPGTHIHVKIDLVWPRDNTLRLSPVVLQD
ncbi:RNB domain-containing ribonuclease [bacterium]|nr:RNB domain-containing ribonuclease [bacterium]